VKESVIKEAEDTTWLKRKNHITERNTTNQKLRLLSLNRLKLKTISFTD
jgi:hypothetical protein